MFRGCRTAATFAASLLVIGACGGDGGESRSTGVATTTDVVNTTSAAPPVNTPLDTTVPPADAALPVVVDTDLAADDLVAMLYLLSDPTVDVLAVTVSGTGEVTCPRGEEVARGLLALVGRDDVPVACGQSLPLSGNREFPHEWRSAADGAYGLGFPAVARSSAAEQDAVELFTAAIATAPAPVTLLTLGPLTNIAQAFTAEPGLATALAGVVVMGGAVDVPGNVQLDGAAPLAAEWNLYIDPEATAVVVASGATVTLVTLDATNEVPVTADLIDRLVANDVTDATSIVADVLTGRAPPFLWDPLAAIATAHPDLVPRRERLIAVVTDGEDAGRTVERRDGSAVLVADAPDADAVLDHLLRTLAGVSEDEPLATPTTVPVVGEAAVSFDGVTCSYDGPTSLPAGALRVTQVAGAVPYYVLVAHLVEGFTVEEAIAWQAEHPGEQPPMIDDFEVIGDGALPSPADVPLEAGENPVVCATDDGLVVFGGSLTVGDGS